MEENMLLKNIQYYLEADECTYGIMIDGEWGSGKTYFVQNKVLPKIDELNLKPLYVSLFGICTINEIKEKMFYELLKINGFEYFNIFNKIDRRIKGGVLAVKEIAKEVSKFNFSNNYMYRIVSSELNDEYVLIFDDLERSKLDIISLLGFMNEYVEHLSIKTILIANQNELDLLHKYENIELKQLVALNPKLCYLENIERKQAVGFNDSIKQREKSTELFENNVSRINETINQFYGIDCIYKQMKEKLIGKTFEYKSDFKEIIRNLESIVYIKHKDIIDENFDFIIEAFEHEQHLNIRTYKSAIEQFDFFSSSVNEMDSSDNFNSEFFNDIFKCVVYSTIVFKKRGYIKKDKDGSISTMKQTLFGMEITKNMNKNFYIFDSVLKSVEYSIIDYELLKKDYIEYELKQKQNSGFKDDWKINNMINQWWIKNDEYIINIIDKIKELKNNEDFSLYSALIALKLLLEFKTNLGFEVSYIDDLIELIHDNLRGNKEQRNILEYSYIFYDKASEEFLDVFIGFNKTIRERNIEIKTKIRNNSYKSQDYGFAFYDDIIYEKQNTSYSEICIIKTTDFTKFRDFILDGDNENLQKFRWSFNRIYDFKNIYDYFKDDIENLLSLKNILISVKQEVSEKLKIYIIDLFIKDIEEYITRLNER